MQKNNPPTTVSNMTIECAAPQPVFPYMAPVPTPTFVPVFVPVYVPVYVPVPMMQPMSPLWVIPTWDGPWHWRSDHEITCKL